jgi:hypothetical protein
VQRERIGTTFCHDKWVWNESERKENSRRIKKMRGEVKRMK